MYNIVLVNDALEDSCQLFGSNGDLDAWHGYICFVSKKGTNDKKNTFASPQPWGKDMTPWSGYELSLGESP